MLRGSVYETPGGGVGRFVGTSTAGVEWVAYDDDDFESMRRKFDASHSLTTEETNDGRG